MRNYLLSLFFIIGLWSCGPSQKSSPQLVRFGKGHTIAMSVSTSHSSVAVAEIVSAAAYTVQQWENFNGCSLQPTFIIVKDDPINYFGETANGVWLGGFTVEVWAGEHYELPALFHELCHSSFQIYYHVDPRWPAWDAEDNLIYHLIDTTRP